MTSLVLVDPAATEALGAVIGKVTGPGDVVLLEGELGAGKTTLVRGLVSSLGGSEVATSPTFTLCHLYDTSPPVAHVDCWRLDATAEVVDLALDEILDDGSLLVIEWGERASFLFGDDSLVVHLSYDGDGRRAEISATGARSKERLAQLERLVVAAS